MKALRARWEVVPQLVLSVSRLARLWRRAFVCVAAVSCLTSVGSARAQTAETAVWTGLGGGNSWSDPLNWAGQTVPDNTGHLYWMVRIDGGATEDAAVLLDRLVTIDRLEISAGDALEIPDGRLLRIAGDKQQPVGLFRAGGQIRNLGQIRLSSTGAMTGLSLAGGGSFYLGDLAGAAGKLILSDSPNNVIVSENPTTALVLARGQEIEGAGRIGGTSSMELLNHGVIRAIHPMNPFLILPAPTGQALHNFGILEAAGGRLVIGPVFLQNALGTIRALAGGVVELQQPTVVGGTFATSDDGSVRMQGMAQLVDVTNAGALAVPPGSTLRISGSELRNAGHIRVGDDDRAAGIAVGGAVTLTGGGEIQLGHHPDTRVFGEGGALQVGSRLHNVDNTIHGGGRLDGVMLAFRNQSLIVADTASPLVISLPTSSTSPSFINAGTLRAVNGAILSITGGSFDNALGRIEALEGSIVDLAGITNLTGGTLSAAGTGLIRMMGPVGLANVSLAGTVQVLSNASVSVNGPLLDNRGVIELGTKDKGGGRVMVYGPVTLTGGGTLRLVHPGGSVITRGSTIPPTPQLTNMDNTIVGTGLIDASGLELINQARIVADQGTPLRLMRSDGGLLTNDGLLRAESGATLELQNLIVNNTRGRIEAAPGGVVSLIRATIAGGAVSASEGGVVAFRDSSTIRGITTLSGDVEVASAELILASVTLDNRGTLHLGKASAGGQLRFADALTLTGGGNVEMAHPSSLLRGTGTRPPAFTRLVNLDNTIFGAGRIGDGAFILVNRGTIRADRMQPLYLASVSGGSFENWGTLHCAGPAGMTVTSGRLDNYGTIQVDAGSRLVAQNIPLVQVGGRIRLASQDQKPSSVSGSDVALLGGELVGDGTVTGRLANSAGVLDPDGGNRQVLVQGDYTQGADGILMIDISGSQAGSYDVLKVAGGTTLGGTLRIVRDPAYVPPPGESFPVIQAIQGFKGQFSRVEGMAAGPGLRFAVHYSKGATLTVVPTGPADLDGDGDVDQDDFNQFQTCATGPSLGPPAEGCGGADLDGDNDVDQSDFGLFQGCLSGRDVFSDEVCAPWRQQ